jgi:hypothetical protein
MVDHYVHRINMMMKIEKLIKFTVWLMSIWIIEEKLEEKL